MIWSIIAVVIGAVALAGGADRFIVASSSLARHLKMPSLIVGILLVGFGTSFPELIVSIIASVHQKAQIAAGNVIGSNIVNIGLVLGLTALIAPIQVNSRLMRREFPILIAVSVLLGLLLYNHALSRIDGLILLVVLALQLYWTVAAKPAETDPIISELEQTEPPKLSLLASIVWWVIGLAVLYVGSELLVNGAVTIAKYFGISDLVIGLTVVTIGTSLPELAATIVSALKKEHDIAIGHVVGSNIFNSLGVLAMPALIDPGHLPAALFYRDYMVMLGFTLLLWLSLFFITKRYRIGRGLGSVLLVAYVIYLACLAI